MTVTIGLVANVYNEANALPGWLECHTPFFDDIRVLHAGPRGARSDDGSIELLEKWRIPVEFCAIDEGFGVVRTRALRMCPCDYVVLLDADERFYPVHRTLECRGPGTPQAEVDDILQSYDFRGGRRPDWDRVARLGADLSVGVGEAYLQGLRLREMLDHYHRNGDPVDAVASIRRHWHDFSFGRPTQNWNEAPDWQMRILRCDPTIQFIPDTRMHERLVNAHRIHHADRVTGPFFDHFHFPFKRMEEDQRRHDIAIYDAIHAGRTPPTRGETHADS